MEIRTLGELAQLIANRDGISIEEAWNAVEGCREEIKDCRTIEQVEDTLCYWLGLEPDYMDLFLF